MKPKIVFWFLFIGIISAPLCAQQNKKLDSTFRYYRSTDKKVDSLARIAFKKEDDTLKIHALGVLYNNFRFSQPLLSKRFAKQTLEISKKIDFKEGLGWGNYFLGAFFISSARLDSARFYYEKALQIHQALNNKKNTAIVLSSLGNTYELEGNYDMAIEIMEESNLIFKEINLYNYAITLGNIGNIYIKKGHYRLALEKSLDALKILDTVYNKPWRKADVQRQVGNIEFFQSNYDNSIRYFSEALKIYEEQNDKLYIANISNDIGNTLYQKNEYERALDYFEKSLNLARENEFSNIEGNALSNLGKVHAKKEDFKKALDHLKAGLSIHKKNNFVANILETQNEIASTYLDMGRPFDALLFLNQTLRYSDSVGFINESINALKYRAIVFEQTGRLIESIADIKQYQALNDTLFKTTKSKQIEELRTIYETEKKEQQIALQEKEITVLEQEVSISNLQRLLMGIGLLLSVIGFYALRQKMKRNKLEHEKVDAELAFKKKELTTHALNLARKNETLENLKAKAQELKEKEGAASGYSQLIRTINFDLQDDNNWENFARYFEDVHKDFNSNVKSKYPEVTSNELRLLALLKMNLSSKEIANILNISPEGIKKARYRLRKKLHITTEDSLQDLVLSL